MRLKGKSAIVTGGSMGIGKAIAAAFLREGAKVAIAARTGSVMDATVREFENAGLGPCMAIRADVSHPEEVESLVQRALSSFGAIDILVNAAGIQKPIGSVVDTDPDEWIHTIHVNLIGAMLCCTHVLRAMIPGKKGKIINFSGGGATSPRPNFSAYACSKAAVVRFTETLAEEVRDFGIDVNAVAPGTVTTRMLQEIIDSGSRAGERELREAIAERERGTVPPDKAAALAVFLASDASDGITGRLISAVWDNWKDLTAREISGAALYTLRRIDGRNYIEVKK